MQTAIITGLIVMLAVLPVWAAVKSKNRGESQLSVFEHPSTFKKPDIETVDSLPERKETAQDGQSADFLAEKDKGSEG